MSRLIQVFRTGTHTDSAGNTRTYTADDLRAIAENFDANTGATPIVIGHPDTDSPAWGWVDRFLFEESTGVLYAVPKELNPDFKAAVQAGHYRRVSIALYSPDSPHNPKPGQWYPRHVGFLGGAAPAVKGLAAANFNDHGEGYSMFDTKDPDQVSKFSEAIANAFASALTKLGFKPAADDGNHGLGGDADPTKSPEYESVKGERDQFEQDLENERKETARLKAEQARSGCAAFVETQVEAGKVTPAEAETVTDLLFSLDADEEVEFSVGSGDNAKTVKQTRRKAFEAFLESLPERIDYSERAGRADGDLESIGFEAPEGATVDSASMDLHRRAIAYAQEHNVEYIDAVSICSRGTH